MHEAFKEERATELDAVFRLVVGRGIAVDRGTLGRASTQCRSYRPQGAEDLWGYKFDGLTFAAKLRRYHPDDARGLRVRLNVVLEGRCDVPIDGADQLTKLTVDILLEGFVQGNRLHFSWHLDRNIVEPEDGEQREMHPLYHMQHGGHYMSRGMKLGDAIIAEPPRLAHAPLDGILAIDFALSNYAYSDWLNLRGDRQYLTVVRAAQKRFWRPYFRSVASYWDIGPCGAECFDIIPGLAPRLSH